MWDSQVLQSKVVLLPFTIMRGNFYNLETDRYKSHFVHQLNLTSMSLQCKIRTKRQLTMTDPVCMIQGFQHTLYPIVVLELYLEPSRKDCYRCVCFTSSDETVSTTLTLPCFPPPSVFVLPLLAKYFTTLFTWLMPIGITVWFVGSRAAWTFHVISFVVMSFLLTRLLHIRTRAIRCKLWIVLLGHNRGHCHSFSIFLCWCITFSQWSFTNTIISFM